MNSEKFLQHLIQLNPNLHFLIAYSGGLDSHVLLHLMTQARAANPEIELTAIHINHGLSPNAESWAKHCQNICEELNITLIIKKFSLKKMPQKSLEAEARKLRYQAFAEEIEKNSCLLTAHNQNDQAETLLLQLFRGAGPKGLAAMPEKSVFGNGFLLRPLLNFSRAQLQEYAEKNKLQWIEDESNLNTIFDRNFVRHKLMPIIQERWPSSAEILSRVARHCAESADLLNELAAQDLLNINAVKPCDEENKLNILALLKLSPARQRNVLREWLHQLGFSTPSEIKILQIQKEILKARSDAKPLVKWEGTEIRRYQNYLYALQPRPVMDSNWEKIWDLKTLLDLPQNLGSLIAEKKQERGYLKLPVNATVSVRFRREGERCQPAGRIGSHPLKKLMQEWKIPQWERDQVPLIYFDDKLVAVVGYCVCQRFMTTENEIGFEIKLSKIKERQV